MKSNSTTVIFKKSEENLIVKLAPASVLESDTILGGAMILKVMRPRLKTKWL